MIVSQNSLNSHSEKWVSYQFLQTSKIVCYFSVCKISALAILLENYLSSSKFEKFYGKFSLSVEKV
jgi:hypothetical protein